MTNEIMNFLEWFNKQSFNADELERRFLEKYKELFEEDLQQSLKRHNEGCKTSLHFIPYLYETNRLNRAYEVFHALMEGK